MSKYKICMGVVYLLLPFSLFLMAWQNNNHDVRQLYNFGIPQYLLPVLTPSNNPTTQEGVALGRRLFYDTLLSGNQKQSCASCHKQALAFTDGDDIAIGSLGKKAHRNTMALVNLGWQDQYFWDGRALTLEDLVHFPVTDSLEMNADMKKIESRLNNDKTYRALFYKAFGSAPVSMQLAAKAISQFLRSITSFNAPFDLIYRDVYYSKFPDSTFKSNYDADVFLLEQGFLPENVSKYGHNAAITNVIKQVSPDIKVLKAFALCITCHYNSLQVFCNKKDCDGTLPEIAKVQFKNNGLEVEGPDKGLYQQTGKEGDRYRFKVPTLRNIVFTAPYMHDGRFKTLEEVVEHYNTGILPNKNLDPLLKDSNNNPIRLNLNEPEKKQLIGMIKLLTDSSVITDRRFSAPVTP